MILCKILIAICIPFLYNELKRYIDEHKGVFCLHTEDNPLSALIGRTFLVSGIIKF